jgi:predicted ATPase
MAALEEFLFIKHLGPIHEIEINPIRPLTVFIGESGSGKSLIMKILAHFRWIYKKVNIRSYLKYSQISDSPLVLSELSKGIGNTGLDQFFTPETEIVYKKGRTVLTYKNSTFDVSAVVPENELSLEKICFIADKRTIIPDLLSSAGKERTMDFFLEETFNDFCLASEQFVKELEVDYLGVKYFSRQTPIGVKHYITNTQESGKYEIGLNTASSGMQATIPLSVIVEYFSRHYDFAKRFNRMILEYLAAMDSLADFRPEQNIGSIPYKKIHMHIEEPELSLYPESQRSLINFIINRCLVEKHDAYDMTVMMTTHSPYVVNHLNLLLMAGTKGTEEEGAFLHADDVDVFEVADGYIGNLKQQDRPLINTRPMSEPIAEIYERYNELKNG